MNLELYKSNIYHMEVLGGKDNFYVDLDKDQNTT